MTSVWMMILRRLICSKMMKLIDMKLNTISDMKNLTQIKSLLLVEKLKDPWDKRKAKELIREKIETRERKRARSSLKKKSSMSRLLQRMLSWIEFIKSNRLLVLRNSKQISRRCSKTISMMQHSQNSLISNLIPITTKKKIRTLRNCRIMRRTSRKQRNKSRKLKWRN